MKNRVVLILAVVILGFCFFGFGSKFVELVRLVAADGEAAEEGVFAVAPLVNYLLASAGFLCVLGWAAAHGMCHDIEGTKQTMLESDAQLDAQGDDVHYTRSVLNKTRIGSYD